MREKILFLLSGAAALSWELLWQARAALVVGSTAASVALTISLMMGGMSLGAVAAGALLARRARLAARPLVVLAVLELAIGALGLLLPLALPLSLAAAIPAALAMGATVPLMKLLSPDDVPLLYGVNAAGALIGILGQTFVVIPAVGLSGAGGAAAAVNLAVAWLALRSRTAPVAARASTGAAEVAQPAAAPIPAALAIAFVTGFVTFALEVAWFRSLRAAFQSTTDSFSLMLAAVLVAIATSAIVARRVLPRRRTVIGCALVGAILIIAATPLIDRVDLLDLPAASYWGLLAKRVLITLPLLGLPLLPVGCMLPLLLATTTDARRVGRLYSINTAGCLAGALVTAWLLLPHIGSYRSALLAATLLALVGVALARGAGRLVAVLAFVGCAAVGVRADSGVGRVRVQAAQLSRELRPLASREGTDATVSVAVDERGNRQLIIDGFQTSGEAPEGHYMQWMGRLPMLFHPHPERALVICFGTGQTANAVRREGVMSEDIVELSPEVIELASLFPSNEGVVDDPRVTVHVTDGRSWLRRAPALYDVVTLEPMEPHFAGANDLYSLEFYRAVAAHLDADGVIAQWVPLHLLLPEESASVVRTLLEVFPNAALWIDPHDHTGILIGKRGGVGVATSLRDGALGAGGRDLDAAAIRAAFALTGDRLRSYAALGTVITDDNQYLAYGHERVRLWRVGGNHANHELNLRILRQVAALPNE